VRGGLGAGSSPACLEASNATPVALVGKEAVRVLGLRLVKAEGLGAVRNVATQTPSPRPQRLKPGQLPRVAARVFGFLVWCPA